MAPPIEGRNLFEEREVRGTHIGYDVRDEKGVRWGVKLGPEAPNRGRGLTSAMGGRLCGEAGRCGSR